MKTGLSYKRIFFYLNMFKVPSEIKLVCSFLLRMTVLTLFCCDIKVPIIRDLIDKELVLRKVCGKHKFTE